MGEVVAMISREPLVNGDKVVRVAFASTDRTRVDLHFGAAERLVIFDVRPGQAQMVGVAQFLKAEMKGENKDKGGAVAIIPSTAAEQSPDLVIETPPEDKVIGKLDFVDDCAAVYAVSIGASSIKRLMALGVQPIIVDKGHEIVDLLNEVSLGMVHGGLSWVTRAMKRSGPLKVIAAAYDHHQHALMTDIDDE